MRSAIYSVVGGICGITSLILIVGGDPTAAATYFVAASVFFVASEIAGKK